jgi:cytochrome c
VRLFDMNTACGDAFVTGSTMSSDFPVSADAFQRARPGGPTDGFVTSFNAAGQMQYSTFIGGAGADYPRGIAAGGDGSVAIVGWTDSANLPIVGGVQTSYGGSEDAFLARITAGSPESDTAPPHSNIAFSGEAGLAGWYLSPVMVTVTAQDDPSGRGVGAIEYSLDGGTFQPYTGPFTIAAQGTTTVAARATDLAGNRETASPAVALRVDSAAPAVTIASPQAREYLHTDILTISVAASDATAGMAGTPTATLDGVAIAASTVNLLELPLGDHHLVATASDAAGNRSQVSVSFQVIATIDSLMQATHAYQGTGAIASGTYRGLIAKLTDAKDAYDRGNLEAARRKLSDFINQCLLSSGSGVSRAAAELLVADAQAVLARL